MHKGRDREPVCYHAIYNILYEKSMIFGYFENKFYICTLFFMNTAKILINK